MTALTTHSLLVFTPQSPIRTYRGPGLLLKVLQVLAQPQVAGLPQDLRLLGCLGEQSGDFLLILGRPHLDSTSSYSWYSTITSGNAASPSPPKVTNKRYHTDDLCTPVIPLYTINSNIHLLWGDTIITNPSPEVVVH